MIIQYRVAVLVKFEPSVKLNTYNANNDFVANLKNYIKKKYKLNTVKTGVSFRHSLRHRNSASASVEFFIYYILINILSSFSLIFSMYQKVVFFSCYWCVSHARICSSVVQGQRNFSPH
jgi:hypothetical protein